MFNLIYYLSALLQDEKKLSLLKSDTKSKPPLPHPPSLSSSSSHSGQLSTSRQSSEMSSSIPSISSSEFDKRSPSPVTRKNKKEILPPFPNKPQPNSHSSSGQNVANNSINYNPHFQGNSSFTNETRPRPAFKVCLAFGFYFSRSLVANLNIYLTFFAYFY